MPCSQHLSDATASELSLVGVVPKRIFANKGQANIGSSGRDPHYYSADGEQDMLCKFFGKSSEWRVNVFGIIVSDWLFFFFGLNWIAML